MFRFNQTRFRNYLANMKYFDGISASTGKNRTAALYCIVIVYELLFLASLQ